MDSIPIRTLVKKTKRYDPKSLGRDAIVYVDISSIDRETKRISDPRPVLVDEAPSRARKQILTDDVIVSTVRPNLNAVALVPQEYHNEIASTGFCVLRAKEKRLEPAYLFYFTQTDAFISRLTRLSIGAGYPAVSDTTVLETPIPLPPLEEQRRIAGILARADRLRRLRRFAADLSNTYLQSVFIEMFGNGSDFETVKFKELMVESPRNGLYLPSSEYGSGTPIIRIDNFYGGILSHPDTFKRVRAKQKHIEDYAVQNGEILINRVNSLDYLGKCALVKGISEPTVFESNMMRIRLNQERIHPIYLARFLTTPRAHAQILQHAKKAVNQASINQQDVKSLSIPTPPLPHQEDFAAIVRRFERLRAQQRESERQAEHLFQTLLHRAFVG